MFTNNKQDDVEMLKPLCILYNDNDNDNDNEIILLRHKKIKIVL